MSHLTLLLPTAPPLLLPPPWLRPVHHSRHFLPVPLLKAHIDAMSYNKMNVLHIHLVDSQSFPFVSTTFPALSVRGAFDQRHIYQPADISDLIFYAKQRGVMVIPEFDVRHCAREPLLIL